MKPNVEAGGGKENQPDEADADVIAYNTRVFHAMLKILEDGDENEIETLLVTTEMLEKMEQKKQ
ncbi:MAG: hypothetical protein M0Z43_05765 [Acidithiobacillus sp.]|jgi:hypothetical protein|nr:hypothetical protein [Acidithiobacillus sp.]